MIWGFSVAKSKLPLAFLNRWRLESWALAFPKDHRTLLSPASPPFYCKEHESRHSSSGGPGKGTIPRCSDV